MDSSARLFEVIASLDSQHAEVLIREGADINSLTDIGEGVWSYVLPVGLEATELALRLGADPNLLDAAERDSLYWAIYSTDANVVEVLVNAGVNLDRLAAYGDCNILHEVALAGNSSVLQALLPHIPTAMLSERNLLGRTPYEEALEFGNTDCAEILKKNQTQQANQLANCVPTGMSKWLCGTVRLLERQTPSATNGVWTRRKKRTTI